MANGIQTARIADQAAYLPTGPMRSDEAFEIFEMNRDRIYSLAFWMTDNELKAEELLYRVFARAFVKAENPSAEALDIALITELRRSMPIGRLTLKLETVTEVASVRTNTLRVHLERAIVALPPTERLIFCMHDGEGYSHRRVARSLQITERDSQNALHQARLKIRELLREVN